ncbi:MAG: citrate lyase ACP [Candidatus Thermoplasmatota archaeon]|nr:citrate lyase ACP [Candidatus Thermoplasmatota archaeon]
MTLTIRLKREAQAGSEEREDCIVKLTPAEPGTGIKIDIEGKSRDFFRDEIFKVFEETLKGMGIEDAHVWSKGRSPLNLTIVARTKAAAIKGGAFE